MTPETLAHYRILSLLGRGGMGMVYLAEDSKLGRQVALKVMSENIARDEKNRRRFLQEARAAAALNHPNIATIHAVEEERGTLLLVMEYIEGETLEALLRRSGSGGLPSRGAVNLVLPIASALHASHQRGVVHRDVKSANVMVSRQGLVKVLDFGIARIGGASHLTEQRTVMGTLDYMSPEQARGEATDHRTDLWSLGVILHELLTGELPFRGDSAPAMLYNIVHTEPRMLADEQAFPDCPAALRQVLRRALAKDRALRHQSGAELAQELEAWLRAAPAGLEQPAPAVTAAYATAAAAGPSTSRWRSTAERRQITFLYCELAARASEQEERDLEDFVLARNRLAEIIDDVTQRYGGYIPVGASGGGLIYFGFPAAHEDDVSRAILAGLEIRDRARAPDTGVGNEFEVRLGISTTLAIVETARSRTGSPVETIVGDGATVARGLAHLGHGSAVLVEARSQRLAQHGVVYRSLDRMTIAGAREPAVVFEAIRRNTETSSFFNAEDAASVTPLAGRQQELSLLLSNWADALEQNGHLVLLAASAGMGKSRLVYELKSRIEAEGAAASAAARAAGLSDPVTPLRIECFCSPFYTSSALHPVLNYLERTLFAGDQGRLGNSECISRLHGYLSRFNLDPKLYLPILAPLLSLSFPPDPQAEELTSERQRALALECLLAVLLESAATQPVLFVLEDLHWADPSTLELLGMLLDYIPGLPMLAVLTHRLEFVPPWPIRGHISSISLTRLSRDEVIALATGVAGEGNLHPTVLEQVIRNAEGTPLFIEELATMIVESGRAGEPLEKSAAQAKLAVPKTLQDSFMARLDRLGEAKYVAQVASVLGREFPRSLLLATADLTEAELKLSLSTLVEAEVLYLRGSHTRQSLAFKHALLQEAAYSSLVKRSRVALHKAAAYAVEQDADLAAHRLELTGHHFQEAGLYPEAIRSWHGAGMKALEASAHQEAIAAFQRALELHKLLPRGDAADETELLLLASIGPSLVTTLGFGAEQVGRNFDRARTLCDDRSESPLLLPALFGVWLFQVVRGNLKNAEDVALLLVTTGEAKHDDDMRLEGYWALGDVQFWQGNLVDSEENLQKTIRLYDRDRFAHHGARFSQDPKVAAECYLSFLYAVQGRAEEANAANARALALARELNHAFSVGWAMGFPSTVACFLDDTEAAIAHADTATQFYKEQRFPFFISSCQAVKGWGLCRRGQLAEGLDLIRGALATMQLIGSDLVLPLFTGLLAESLLLAGDHEQALEAARQGLAATFETGARLMQIRLHRILGDILVAAPVPDFSAARQAYEQSSALAAECHAYRFLDVARARLTALETQTPQSIA